MRKTLVKNKKAYTLTDKEARSILDTPSKRKEEEVFQQLNKNYPFINQ